MRVEGLQQTALSARANIESCSLMPKKKAQCFLTVYILDTDRLETRTKSL